MATPGSWHLSDRQELDRADIIELACRVFGIDDIAEVEEAAAQWEQTMLSLQNENMELKQLRDDLLAALDLISRIADFENGKVTPEEWQMYVEPFSAKSQVSMIYIMEAIKAIANRVIVWVQNHDLAH